MTTTLNQSDEITNAIEKMPRRYRGVIRRMLTPELVSAARNLKKQVDDGKLDRRTALALFQ